VETEREPAIRRPRRRRLEPGLVLECER
jgi:hypothetical protein